MVRQLAPLQVWRGLAKTYRVVFKCLPANQQHVLVVVFKAALQVVADVARHAGDDFLGLRKRGFKPGRLPLLDLQLRDFQNLYAAFFTICSTHSRGAIGKPKRSRLS